MVHTFRRPSPGGAETCPKSHLNICKPEGQRAQGQGQSQKVQGHPCHLSPLATITLLLARLLPQLSQGPDGMWQPFCDL